MLTMAGFFLCCGQKNYKKEKKNRKNEIMLHLDFSFLVNPLLAEYPD
jgi:hypothetical protein